MKATVLTSPFCTRHNMGHEHPECPRRIHQIKDQFIASGLDMVLDYHNADAASKEQLTLAHDADFVDDIFAKAPQEEEQRVWLDDDTIMTPHTLKAALHAAGAGIEAVDMVMDDSQHLAFCAVRPPGHHAGAENSAGFCVFNNVAVAARYALEKKGLQRVAVVDFDVHHGDGTQNIVEGDERICFCSSFQHPFYPNTGDGESRANIHNVPIAAGTKGPEYRQLITHWFDILDRFEPELILVSAGFDAHAEDDLAHLRLVEDDYYWLAQQLNTVAMKHCNGRMVAILEGGYALSALSRSVAAFIKGVMG